MTLNEKALSELLDKQQITEVLYRYARGWDRYDTDTLYACFHPDSTHQHAGFEGLSYDFIKMGLEMVEPVKSMTHLITNPLIMLKGDKALSECHFLAHHRRFKASGEGEEDMFLKGRYIDKLEKREGEWRIAHRTAVHDFERIVEPADQSLADAPGEQLGHRKPEDALYQFIENF